MILDHIARPGAWGWPMSISLLGPIPQDDYKGRFLPQQRLAPEGWQRRGDARA
jgi:hypothetical protein